MIVNLDVHGKISCLIKMIWNELLLQAQLEHKLNLHSFKIQIAWNYFKKFCPLDSYSDTKRTVVVNSIKIEYFIHFFVVGVANVISQELCDALFGLGE